MIAPEPIRIRHSPIRMLNSQSGSQKLGRNRPRSESLELSATILRYVLILHKKRGREIKRERECMEAD